MPESHYQSEAEGAVAGLANQIHEMTPQQFFLLAAAFCESMAAYVEGPYKESFVRMIEKIQINQPYHRKIQRAKEELAQALNCWMNHPGKSLQFHQFVLYAVSSVITEVAMIIVAKPLIEKADYDVLTSFYRKVMGNVPEDALTEIPAAFKSAFDTDIPENVLRELNELSREAGDSNEGRSGEVPEDSTGSTVSEGRDNKEYFYDPSDS